MSKTNQTAQAVTATKNTYHLVGVVNADSPLATCGPALSKANPKGAPTPVPSFVGEAGRVMYMPGSGFKSKLRGAACNLIFEALKTRGAKLLSLADAQLNRVGGIKQGGSEAAINTTDYLAMIAANPVLGIFGASTPWISGKGMFGHLTCQNPNLEPMVVDGVRADIVRREPTVSEYLADGALDQYAAETGKAKVYSLVKAQIKELTRQIAKSKGDDKKVFQAQLAALEKRVKDEGLTTVSALMPLSGYQAIPPGSKLDSKLTLVGVSELELGCFLAAMGKFAQNPVLGAHSAHGAGQISGTWSVVKVGSGNIGSVTVEPYVGLNIDNATNELSNAVQAFTDFIATDACVPYVDMASMMAIADDNNDE
jgi:hypothetical protein